MNYKKLSDVAYYSELRTRDITIENYITTDNMLPNIGGICTASSIPDCKTARCYEEGDILLSNIRPYFCKIWYANRCGSASNDVLVIKNKEDIDSKFLYYVLCDKNFFNYDTVTSKGTKMPRGTPNAIMKYLVPDVDDKVQKKIASVLSAYDDLIEKNNRKIEILQDMAEELYKEWFVRFRFPGYKTAKFENGIPKDWDIDKLKNKVNRLPFNRLYKEADLEKEGEVIVIDQSEKEFLGFHNNEPSHVANIDEPICLFGDHSCKFKLMSEPFSLGENVVPFKGQGINSYYLFYATHKIIETEEYKRHWGLFVSKKILIPPEPLQNSFADFIKTMHKQVDKITKCQRLLIKQRDLLLPRLMSGKLEVKVKQEV